jgi:hypothetical protein
MAERHSIARLREVLAYDFESGVLTWRVALYRNLVRAGDAAGSRMSHPSGHPKAITVKFEGISYLAHRLAWALHVGNWPGGMLDHINGNPYDNRIVNLRPASHRLNQQNQRRANRRNKCGYLGVSKHGPSWRYSIRSDGKDYIKSGFRSAKEAHQSYVAIKRVVHAEGCTL